MISELAEKIAKLKSNPLHQEMVERFSDELHDIFEAMLVTALTENPGQQIDGAAILATLMQCFKEISKPPQPINTTVPAMTRLPSERYGRTTDS